MNKRNATILAMAFIFATALPASASSVEITDFFSDFTSSDATVNSSIDFKGNAVFELLYAGSIVESHAIPLDIRKNEPVTKVILWQKKPQYDYYLAKVSIYNNSKLLASSSYEISYRTAALPLFHVVDFSPSNTGVKLLLRPFNPSAADIKIELLDNNNIVYTKNREDVSLTTNTEIKFPWPFLLENNKKYIVRAKVFMHRLYAPPLINSYVANFTATSEVEILADEVEVDEYGASVTVTGKSQVPFEGFIVVTARNRETNETQIFRTQMEEILVSGKEDTAGVVWRGLAPGTYDVVIQAVDKKNVAIDKYETALRITEYANVSKSVPAKSAPGFGAFFIMMILLIAERCRYV